MGSQLAPPTRYPGTQKLATERANSIDALQEAVDVTQKLALERASNEIAQPRLE